MALQRVYDAMGNTYYVDVTQFEASGGRIGNRQRFEAVSPSAPSGDVTESVFEVTAASTVALAANANRVGGFIQNNSDEDVNISFGGTASSSTTKIFGGGGTMSLIIDGQNCYTGAINAICASGGKDIVIVEIATS